MQVLAYWKSFDEPNLHGVSATSLRYAYSTIHALDGAHVSVTIQAPTGSATQLRPYSAVTDVHGVDVFPVRYGVQRPDLHSVGRWTARMRSCAPTGSVVTTLQICSGTSDDPGGSGRFAIPSLGQERYMAYDAIINGARGLLFYGGHNPHCYHAQDRALGWNWTFWSQVLKPLLSEIGTSWASVSSAARGWDRPWHDDIRPDDANPEPGRRQPDLGDRGSLGRGHASGIDARASQGHRFRLSA